MTKYGLQLALALPALQACDRWKLKAQVRWGQRRQALTFHLDGQSTGAEMTPLRLPDEVQELLSRLNAEVSDWQAAPAADILEVRGTGLCVPDLRFTNRHTGEIAYLEVMGFWSRDAVWKRVELAKKGLPHRVIFAVSNRLRVSESALGGSLPAELYVYKNTLNAKEIIRRLNRQRAA